MAETQGPPMIVATEALSSPKVRIGHIGGNFTLPRTIPLASLVAGGIGAFVGLLFGVAVLSGLQSLLVCTFLGATAGVLAVTWSPLKGESLSRWLGLRVHQSRQRIKLQEGVVQIAVGVAVLKSATTGMVRIVPGAVNIPPSQYDERGAAINPDDLLREAISAKGLTDMAETVLTGALSLDELESAPAPSMRRVRRRPFSDALAPRVHPLRGLGTARPLQASPLDSSSTLSPSVDVLAAPDLPDLADMSDWLPASSRTTASAPSSTNHTTLRTPTVSSDYTELRPTPSTPTEVPSLADLFETPSLEDLFDATPESPVSVTPAPLTTTFATTPKEKVTGWVVPDATDAIAPGWTRPPSGPTL